MYILTTDLLLQIVADKWQTRLLVGEGALQEQNSNCWTVTNIW
jgi:hypothetical protein